MPGFFVNHVTKFLSNSFSLGHSLNAINFAYHEVYNIVLLITGI